MFSSITDSNHSIPVPLVYSNFPNPNERRELKCSFIYTKDNLKVSCDRRVRWEVLRQVEQHSASRVGGRAGDHWALAASLLGFAPDRDTTYSARGLAKLQETLQRRSGVTSPGPLGS